ncbi:MAG TPA: phosphoribosylamine--glycine ligase [Candidatus Acidoferrales bacterium]|jgi:phosphoribosylamine--glycine ligase|nr:phosphoribosylamine--glycine ligase [Candidatus Acidoferrales bacterium]
MNILVVGSGGREHAIVWKLKQSQSVGRLWCAPGNGGIEQDAPCLPLDLNDPNAPADLAQKLGADLTVIGPELPLVLGATDELERRGLAVLGPSEVGAQLEGSKVFAKQFMERHGIPTAATYAICDSTDAALRALDKVNWPAVIKADGLCAGKGVLVASSLAEATDFVRRAIEQRDFGDAGTRLLIEEGLRGEELSYIILTDGENFIRMAPARDHKRAYDNDTGPNTGGMGAYSIDTLLPAQLEQQIIETVVRPSLIGLRKEGIRYRGFLYFGLMLTRQGPKVLEYNCRLGDPETQAIMLRANFDLAQACLLAAKGSLAGFVAKWLPGASACVVLGSEGYPAQPVIGREISGLNTSPGETGTVVFHAGSRRTGDSFYTTGGRVLAVAAHGVNLDEALQRAYERIAAIHIEGAFYRHDIGAAARKARAVVPA